jgi:outer membrane protein OmpA-like peptidoglycan-associated protein
MPAATHPSWRDMPTHGSTFRTRRERGLAGWILAAMITSVIVHAGLWFVFEHISLPNYFSQSSGEERIPVDLRRAKINEEAARETPMPEVKPIEREKPLVEEPVDLAELAKALPEMELRATPEADVARNITLSPRPSAGAPQSSALSALAAVPTRADSSTLSKQLANLPARILKDPKVSTDQVVIEVKDEPLPGEDTLQDSINAAVKKGNQGVGDADGFASLDDLLSYKGPVTEDKKAMVPTDLLFEYDSADLRDSARLSLMKLGFIIQRNPNAEITIEGHTDLFGGDEYNARLSLARAGAVRDWLVESLRLDGSRLHVRGLGRSRPLISGGSVEQQAKNRRVEIIIRPR